MSEKPTLNIVLVEPRIPQNTGNVARTCACTACRLHLVGPMGFAIDDKKLKHAGLDYWHYLDISYYDSLDEFFAKNSGPYYYFTTKDDMVKAVVEGYCSYLGTLAEQIADGEGTAREKFARLMHPEVWHECFTAPLTADLCLPQHAALYTDMCDRVYAHMGPALEKMTAQALRESGRDEKDAKRLTGVALYGILMMARRGEMTLEGAMNMIAQVLGLNASEA